MSGSTIASYDGTSETNISDTPYVSDTVYKAANAFSGAARVGSVNGGSVIETAFDGSFGITTYGFGCNGGGGADQLNGYLQQVMILPRKMSPAELVTLTS
jgi:hypothetical protein